LGSGYLKVSSHEYVAVAAQCPTVLMDKEKHPADPPQDEEGLRTKLLSDKEDMR
jgi:hypothetical protein